MRPRGRRGAATREQLLAATTQRSLAGERIDIQAICAELGLSRATVHRWYGSRDRVIGEVLVRLGLALFRRGERSVAGSGPERLVEVLVRQLRALTADAAFLRFLAHERETAQRILTAPTASSSHAS